MLPPKASKKMSDGGRKELGIRVLEHGQEICLGQSILGRRGILGKRLVCDSDGDSGMACAHCILFPPLFRASWHLPGACL